MTLGPVLPEILEGLDPLNLLHLVIASMIAALSLILTTKKLNSKIHMELVSVLINGRVHMGIINLLDLENGGPLSVLYRFNLNVRTTLATNMHGQVFFF